MHPHKPTSEVPLARWGLPSTPSTAPMATSSLRDPCLPYPTFLPCSQAFLGSWPETGMWGPSIAKGRTDPSALDAGIRALPGGSTNQPRQGGQDGPRCRPHNSTPAHPPCPTRACPAPWQLLSGWQPLKGSQPTVFPFLPETLSFSPLQTASWFEYSCYQGDRGTQSPQLPWLT